MRRSISITVLQNPERQELQQVDLQVHVGQASLPVLSLKHENITPRVVLLLDTSGSMRGDFASKWKNALIAAEFVLEAVPEDSLVALVTFDMQAHVTGFGSREDAQKKLMALKDVLPIGRTALYDAVQDSLRLFNNPRFGDTIYIISDGGDDYGKQDGKETTDAVLQRAVRIFAFIVQNPGGSKTSEERDGPAKLFALVKSTGGSYQNPQITQEWIASKRRLDSVEAVRSQLQSPYRLDIQLAAPPAKSLKLQIKVLNKHIELAYPQRIETCSTLSAVARP